MARRKGAIALLCGLTVTPVVTTAAAGSPRPRHRIRFARGRSAAEVRGAVLRGESAAHVLEARAGQTMRVRITSLEKNAAFTIYPPASARPIPGTEEARDATTWSGKLPRSGDYVIRVGTTRGNAEYTLRVEVTSDRP